MRLRLTGRTLSWLATKSHISTVISNVLLLVLWTRLISQVHGMNSIQIMNNAESSSLQPQQQTPMDEGAGRRLLKFDHSWLPPFAFFFGKQSPQPPKPYYYPRPHYPPDMYYGYGHGGGYEPYGGDKDKGEKEKPAKEPEKEKEKPKEEDKSKDEGKSAQNIYYSNYYYNHQTRNNYYSSGKNCGCSYRRSCDCEDGQVEYEYDDDDGYDY